MSVYVCYNLQSKSKAVNHMALFVNLTTYTCMNERGGVRIMALIDRAWPV